MKPARKSPLAHRTSSRALAGLRARLAEAQAALRAIRRGEVDAVVVSGRHGPQVFTLHGAEHAYRVLIESMNEGALTLTTDRLILYANRSFARMVHHPLEQVVGRSFRDFLSVNDRTKLRPLLRRAAPSGSKIQVRLLAGNGAQIPAQISLRPLANNGLGRAITGVVVTDLTEATRTADQLRALTHRVVDVLEAERGRVAVELHDQITQHLCGLLFRCQALSNRLPADRRQSKAEAERLVAMLGRTAEAVERLSRNLQPRVLDQLGLVAFLRGATGEFAKRTGIAVKLACGPLAGRLPPDTELALYRILQEALSNVERHGRARRVTVALRQRGNFIQFLIKDDGIGFDPNLRATKRREPSRLGLLSMEERATYVGAALRIRSGRGVGTEIAVMIPLPNQRRLASR